MKHQNTPLDRAWIEGHIPHKGSMCLLDEVALWTDAEIVCVARSHRDPAHPLRDGERLGMAAGIEYAAQAMAVHGALLDDAAAQARVGYLASARDVVWHANALSACEGDLRIRAERVSASALTVQYRFEVSCDERALLSGRATVILDAEA